MAIKIDGYNVTTTKDCKQCTHKPVCRLLEKQHNFTKEIGKMNRHDSDNNLNELFETQSNCVYYDCNMKKGKVQQLGNQDLITTIVPIELKKRGIIVDGMISYNIHLNTIYLNAKIEGGTEKRSFTVTELIENYIIE